MNLLSIQRSGAQIRYNRKGHECLQKFASNIEHQLVGFLGFQRVNMPALTGKVVLDQRWYEHPEGGVLIAQYAPLGTFFEAPRSDSHPQGDYATAIFYMHGISEKRIKSIDEIIFSKRF